MTVSVAPADVYTDPKGLNDLRTRASKNEGDLETLRAVAGQFEALFIQMMLKSMRDASLGEGIFDSDQGDTYQSLFDQQISIELGRQQSLGLADMMVQQLRPQVAAHSADGEQAPAQTGLRMPASSRAGASSVSNAAAIDADADDWRPDSREAFVRALLPHADAAARELGVDPEVLIAQAALETGWGQSMIRDGAGRNSFNYFGIKADPSWDGARTSTGTLEFRDGVMRKETALFRAYESPAASFGDYVAFLKDNPRYATALNAAGDGASYVKELQQAGYATDPDYASKIMRIAESDPIRETVTEFKNEEGAPLS